MTAVLFESQKTSAELAIYPHDSDPILLRPKGSSIGPSSRFQGDVQLVGLSVSDALSAGGDWQARLKVPSSLRHDFENAFTDDDWADITLSRGPSRWHQLRGVVDSVQRGRDAGGGATTVSYELRGRSHQAVFQNTRVWFNSYSGENLLGGAALRASILVGADGLVLTGVADTVKVFLLGFLKKLGQLGRSLWSMPNGMPGVPTGASFADVLQLKFDQSVDLPPRNVIGANLVDTEGGNLWEYGVEWSDPGFNELFCALLNSDGTPLDPSRPAEPESTSMAVVLRPRPFPTDEDPVGADQSDWFLLPMVTIPRQWARLDELTRSGAERINTVQVSPRLIQELIGPTMQLRAPLIDADDVIRHGVRPLDIDSRYMAKTGNDVALAESQRRRLRDYHCLNPQFWSGPASFTRGLPELRVGMRLRIKGQTHQEDETFYAEGVQHNWSLRSGVQTSATLTRGWVGTDDSLIRALRKRQAGFRVPVYAQAVPETETLA